MRYWPNTALNMVTGITTTTQIRNLGDYCSSSRHHLFLLALILPFVRFLLHVAALYLRLLLTFIQPFYLSWISCPVSLSSSSPSLFLNRSVPCFCRRGAQRHARSISCDAPSAFQLRHSFQNTTARCPPRAVSSLRTHHCSDEDASHTHTHTHAQTQTH